MLLYVQRDHKDFRNGEPWTSTSTFRQLPSSVSVVTHEFNVALRPQRPYGLLGTGSQGQPPRLSHSSWALTVCQFNVDLRPQRPYRLLGTESPGRPPRLYTVPELCPAAKHIPPFVFIIAGVIRWDLRHPLICSNWATVKLNMVLNDHRNHKAYYGQG